MRLPARFSAPLFALALAVPLHAQVAMQSPLVVAPAPVAADTSVIAASAAPATPTTQAATASFATRDAAPASTLGAPLTGLRAGVHHQESSAPASLAASRAGLGQSRALMAVGVAGLIVGAIIGGTPGTVIMVGGAVVGLIGLYDYMQ